MKDEKLSSIIDIVNQELSGSYVINEDQINDDLKQFGLDSIELVKVVANLEDYFNIEILDEDLLFYNLSTINKIIDVLKKSNINIIV